MRLFRIKRWPVTLVVPALLASVGVAYGVTGAGLLPARSDHPIPLRALPASDTVSPGGHARYRIVISRSWYRTLTKLSVSGMPAGFDAKFTRVSRHAALLTVTTNPLATTTKTYKLRVHAVERRSDPRRSSVTVTLKVVARTVTPPNAPPEEPVHAPFGIDGSVDGLIPGIAQPIDLRLSNPNGSALPITAMSVSIADVSAPNATADLPCSADDFTVTQYSGAYPLTLAASETTTLSSRGIPASQWPALTLVNRAVNQDGCKGASVSLSYGGSAAGQ